ncbi:MAG: hypothetical protein NVS1B12_06500 [Acidimicrobiales bacterium]
MWLNTGVDLTEAAARLGVHYQTAYKWVRDGSLVAVKRGSTYDIADAEVERFIAARRAPSAPPRTTIVRDWELQRDRLYRYLSAGDELGARAVVDRLRDGGIEPLTLMEELFTPVLAHVGQDWADGVISVAAEHRASAICERLLARAAVHPRGRPRGVAVVATPPGEEHSLPAAMAAVALRADRWQVHHLGTQVPIADLVDLTRAVAADLVVLSVTSPATAAAAEGARSAIEGAGARVLVGAPGMALRSLLAFARQSPDDAGAP